MTVIQVKPTPRPKCACTITIVGAVCLDCDGNVDAVALRARIEQLETAIRYWAAEEPECNCGELAPGPCCAACRADRALRATLNETSPSNDSETK